MREISQISRFLLFRASNAESMAPRTLQELKLELWDFAGKHGGVFYCVAAGFVRGRTEASLVSFLDGWTQDELLLLLPQLQRSLARKTDIPSSLSVEGKGDLYVIQGHHQGLGFKVRNAQIKGKVHWMAFSRGYPGHDWQQTILPAADKWGLGTKRGELDELIERDATDSAASSPPPASSSSSSSSAAVDMDVADIKTPTHLFFLEKFFHFGSTDVGGIRMTPETAHDLFESMKDSDCPELCMFNDLPGNPYGCLLSVGQIKAWFSQRAAKGRRGRARQRSQSQAAAK